MATLQPRQPYSDAELSQLYPQGLELKQVQILLRHGERTPVSSRFQNAGLNPYWPYCKAANELKSIILTADGSLDSLAWKRRLETIGPAGRPMLPTGPQGETDSICQPGELTDKGRETTLALGQRMRMLYVDQLKFLPAYLDQDAQAKIRLRATAIPRALASVQQSFTGLYPPALRTPGMAPPAIAQRLMQDDTLVPNEYNCKRLRELKTAFAARTAERWNDSPEMQHINKKLGKWMPEESPKIGVDSHPRLNGVMDTINATGAHGPDTRLPQEFYDPQVLSASDRIVREEWFVGYEESAEYRRLGIGSLVGDITQHMVENIRGIPAEDGTSPFKISMSGCHDTTIASTLSALGAYRVDRDPWPKFTSSIAFELFQTAGNMTSPAAAPSSGNQKSIWFTILPTWLTGSSSAPSLPRDPLSSMSDHDRRQIDNHYVRIRYNDKPIMLPYCQQAGKHLPADKSFCTLKAFKEMADELAPIDWRADCGKNLGTPAFPSKLEPPPGVGNNA
jgi:acid phosphatase